MAKNKTYETLTIDVGGVTKAFSVNDSVEQYNVVATGGAVILAGNIAISSSGTPAVQTTFDIRFGGGFTLGANTCTIFGYALTTAQCLYEQKITAIYNGSSWDVHVCSDLSTGRVDINGADIVPGSIVNASIASSTIALGKLAVMTARGYVPVAGVNGAWTVIDGRVAGAILLGDGTDLNSVVPTGDVTINGAGATTIGASKVTAAMLNFTITANLEATLTIASASVLALNGTPVTIVAAPGAGKYIEVISASATMTFVSAAYAANTTLRLINAGASVPQLQDTAILISTVTKNTRFKDVTSATAGQTQIIANTALQVDVAIGNPTTGDSIIKVKVVYRIVTI